MTLEQAAWPGHGQAEDPNTIYLMFGKVSKVPGPHGSGVIMDSKSSMSNRSSMSKRSRTRVAVKDVFCLDFRGPIAPLEAFAIAPAAYRVGSYTGGSVQSCRWTAQVSRVVVRIAAGQLPWRRSEL